MGEFAVLCPIHISNKYNITTIYLLHKSRGDSGPMSHFSDYSPLHVNSHSRIYQRVNANRAII